MHLFSPISKILFVGGHPKSLPGFPKSLPGFPKSLLGFLNVYPVSWQANESLPGFQKKSTLFHELDILEFFRMLKGGIANSKNMVCL